MMALRMVIIFCVLASVFAIDCEKDCKIPDYTNPNYKPQDCALHCKFNVQDVKSDTRADELKGLQMKVQTLSSMVTATLVLVIVLVALLIALIASNSHLLDTFRKLWASLDKKEKATPPKILNGDIKETKVAIPEEPILRTRPISQISNGSKLETTTSVRKTPCESTFPDEGDAIEVNGYDNLAMSRSTLATQSPPSSPVSPAITDVSMFNTTTTTVHLDSTRSSPSNHPRHSH